MIQSQLGNLIQSILTMVDQFMVTKASLMTKLPIRDVTMTETEITTETKIATVNLIEEITKILEEETRNPEEMMEVIDGAKEDLRKTIDHLREVES